MATKNAVGIAKGKPTTRKPATRKPVAKKTAAPKLTPEQERDLKAKQKVEELLKNSPFTKLDKKEDLLVLDEDQEPKGTEWLQEQLPLLIEQLQKLNTELTTEKQKNEVLTQKLQNAGGDGEATKAINMLFDELQTNHIKMGKNPSTGAPNLVIHPIAFLNRLIQLFPPLAKKKQF